MSTHWLYILRCSDGSYYTGTTSNLEHRLVVHQAGMIPSYTESRRPVELVFAHELPDELAAYEMERRVKGWTRKKKEALISGNYDLLHMLATCRNTTHSKYKCRAGKGKGSK